MEADRSYRRDAMVPAWIGLGVAGAFVALNVLSYVVGLIAG